MNNRREFLQATGAGVLGTAMGSFVSPAWAESAKASVAVDLEHSLGACNPLLLGSNIEWTNKGDGLLTDNDGFEPNFLDLVRELAPPLLRYPGGTLSDNYHWKDGVGPFSKRGSDRDLTNHLQPVLFGSDELARLAKTLDADITITVNVPTGTPDEAASWVRYLNGGAGTKGHAPRPVRYWEVGNEPYLMANGLDDLALEPAAFASKADAIIRAIKTADPQIKVGIPLRSNRIGGRPATPFQGYDAIVLKHLGDRADYVAVHDAYMPFANDRVYSLGEIYWGLMAGTRTVESDFEATRDALKTHVPNRDIKLAVTEYNAFVSLGKPTDPTLCSIAGAMYVADLLRLMALTPQIAFANFWSLSGNWYFGAIDQQCRRRPVFYVLSAYRKFLRGNLVNAKVGQTPTFSVGRVGAVEPASGVPSITACAAREGNTARVVLINKELKQTVACTVSTKLSKIGKVTAQALWANDARAGMPGQPEAQWTRQDAKAQGGDITLSLRPYSLTLLEVDIA